MSEPLNPGSAGGMTGGDGFGGPGGRPGGDGLPPKTGTGATHPVGGDDVLDPAGEVDGDRGRDTSGGMIGEG
jgi:hypothetical protein